MYFLLGRSRLSIGQTTSYPNNIKYGENFETSFIENLTAANACVK